MSKQPNEHTAWIAHDLKNPLSAISVLASALRLKLDGERPDLVMLVTKIERNVGYMDSLIREVMDLSAIDHDHLQLQRQTIDLVSLLASIRDRAPFGDAPVQFEIDDDQVVGVVADPVRIERVILNLIDNALKYSGCSSPVTVRLQRLKHAARMSIIDSGPGVAPVDADKIFELHRRLDTSTSHEGSGIGLYVSRKIVEAHGGSLGVESQPGRSVFAFELPFEIPRRRILLVDHDIGRLLPLAGELRTGGVDPIMATSLVEALANLEDQRPELVLIDATLLGDSEAELVARFHGLVETIPVGIVVDSSDHAAHPAFRSAAYLTRPIDSRRLLGDQKQQLSR